MAVSMGHARITHDCCWRAGDAATACIHGDRHIQRTNHDDRTRTAAKAARQDAEASYFRWLESGN